MISILCYKDQNYLKRKLTTVNHSNFRLRFSSLSALSFHSEYDIKATDDLAKRQHACHPASQRDQCCVKILQSNWFEDKAYMRNKLVCILESLQLTKNSSSSSYVLIVIHPGVNTKPSML